MKRLFALLMILVFLLTSCNSLPTESTESSDIENTSNVLSIEPETTISPESKSENAPEATWYYEDYKSRAPWQFPEDTGEYPEDIKNTYLTFPSVYEVSNNGLDFYIEFYYDTVYMHDYQFARITVTNPGSSFVRFAGSPYAAGFFIRNDGEIYVNLHNGAFGFSEQCDSMGLPAGKSFTHEIYFYIDHDFFKAGYTYFFATILSPESLPKEEYKRLEIPISINISQ